MNLNLKILDRYIYKQLIETFLIGIVIFTALMFASDTFIVLVKQIATYGIPLHVALLIVLLKLPSMLVFTTPMGVLLSVIMTVSSMSTSLEITILKACRVGVARIAKPILIFGIIATVAGFFTNEVIVPAASKQVRTLTLWAISQKNVPKGETNFVFKEVNNDKLKRFFYAATVTDKTLNNVTVLDLSKEKTIQVIYSAIGKASKEGWVLENGIVYTIATTGKILNTTSYTQLDFNTGSAFVDKLSKVRDTDMSFFELKKYLDKQKDELKELEKQASLPNQLPDIEAELKGSAASLAHHIKWLTIARYLKTSIPFSSIVFTIVAIPLAITPPRVRFNRGLLFSILILFCYYVIRSFSVSMGESGTMNPILAAWMPNLVIGSIGLYLFYRKAYTI